MDWFNLHGFLATWDCSLTPALSQHVVAGYLSRIGGQSQYCAPELSFFGITPPTGAIFKSLHPVLALSGKKEDTCSSILYVVLSEGSDKETGHLEF